MSSRRSEVSTALNDAHVVSFSSHLHSSNSSSLLHSSGSGSSLLTSATSMASMAPAAASAAASAYTGSVLMQGKLMRRDRTFLTWKWRDFTLERTRLQYFSEKGIRKGEIVLTPTTPITIRLLSEPKPHSFLLFIKDEKLTLAALNENEQRKWIDVFCDVFHASVEQAPSDKGDRRTRPTFLPIPDISTAKDASSHGHAAGANGTSGVAGASANAAGSNGASAGAGVDREPDVIPILESRMTYGPIKESYSRVTFPPSLANGDLLVGVGPIVRRMGWTDERILAVGLYIDPEGARKQLETFHGRTVKSLYGDQTFYDHVLSHTTFRRSFVITSRKRVSKSVLTALLHDEIAPRIGTAKDGLDTFLGFIEKSLKKAESMVLRVNPDGRLEYRLRGQLYPPIASHALCKCIQAVFFDVNSIQHDAKRGLIERLPSLWGGEALDAQDEIFGRVSHHHNKLLESESEYDGDEFDEFDDDDDDFDDFDDSDDDLGGDVFDEGDEDAELAAAAGAENDADSHAGDGAHDTGDHRPSRTSAARKSEFARRKSRRSSLHHHRRRTMSRKEELDDLDEREHEYLRRESRSVTTHFGPLLDPDSNVHFASDLVVDGSALLGTWSQTIERPSLLDADAQAIESTGLSTAAPYRFTVGLYAEPGGASENLLKYKGLSVGSIVQDPDFFARFAQGSFRKHLVFKVESKMRLHTLIAYFDAHLKHLASRPHGGSGSGASLPAASPPLGPQTTTRSSGAESGSESKANESFLDAFQDYQYKQVRPRDEVRFSIEYDGRMTLFMRTRGSVVAKDASSGDSDSDVIGRNDVDVPLPSPPFAMLFQSIFYGFHTIDARSRAQLMQRLPNLLDLAKDDLVHTYHDEIQVLKENYKRQKPENRVKVGYMAISFEKKKLTKTIDGSKEPTVVPSRWSKRWCRLDGVMFSYFSHKRSRKARDVMDLTACDVAEITSLCANELAPFAVERDSARPSIKIAITKPSGEILALRTESIYEGEEWLESLTDASQVRRLSDAAQPPAAWENSMARLRRSSSVYRSLRGVTPAQLEALKSSGIHRTNADAAAAGATGAGVDGASSGELDAQLLGAGHVEDDDDDDGGEDDATALLEDDGDVSDATMVVDKDASLLLWVREDPRHGVIAFLLVLVLWLVSSRVRADAEAVLAT